MHRRSPELTRLDDAIGTGNPVAAKRALDMWIAAQATKNQDWRTSVRNSRGAVQRLFDQLGLGRDFLSFVDRLVSVTANCRAGTRVLQVANPDPLNPGRLEMTDSARLWADCGFLEIVHEDTTNVRLFYETLGALRREVATGGALKVWLRSAPPHVGLAGGNFPDWAEIAIGNCAEMGSADAALWAEAACRHARINWNPYLGTIEAAKRRGEAEQAAFERAKEERQRSPGQFTYPPNSLASANLPKYLKEFVRLNTAVPHARLLQGFTAERERMKAVFMLDDDDPELITWEAARQRR